MYASYICRNSVGAETVAKLLIEVLTSWTVVLTKLSLGLNWIKSTREVTELNVCRSQRCRAFGT